MKTSFASLVLAGSACVLAACTAPVQSTESASSSAVTSNDITGANYDVIVKGLIAMGVPGSGFAAGGNIVGKLDAKDITCWKNDGDCVARGGTRGSSRNMLSRADADAFFAVVKSAARDMTEENPASVLGPAYVIRDVSCVQSFGGPAPSCSYTAKPFIAIDPAPTAPTPTYRIPLPLGGPELSGTLSSDSGDTTTYTIYAPALARYDIVVTGVGSTPAQVHVDVSDTYSGDSGRDSIRSIRELVVTRLLDPGSHTVTVSKSAYETASDAAGSYTIRFAKN